MTECPNSEDLAGILIALQRRDRVRRIRLGVHVSDMQRIIAAIDDGFPMLEYLCIMPVTEGSMKWIHFEHHAYGTSYSPILPCRHNLYNSSLERASSRLPSNPSTHPPSSTPRTCSNSYH